MEWRSFRIAGRTQIIDETGRVPKISGKGFKKPFPDKDGYLKYAFQDNITKRTCNVIVHRLVYQVFVGDIPEGMSVDHIDNDRLNNHPSNLQLMTPEDNAIKGNAKVWLVVSPDGERMLVYNLQGFCKERGLHPGHMHETSRTNSKLKFSKGWKAYDFSN